MGYASPPCRVRARSLLVINSIDYVAHTLYVPYNTKCVWESYVFYTPLGWRVQPLTFVVAAANQTGERDPTVALHGAGALGHPAAAGVPRQSSWWYATRFPLNATLAGVQSLQKRSVRISLLYLSELHFLSLCAHCPYWVQ